MKFYFPKKKLVLLPNLWQGGKAEFSNIKNFEKQTFIKRNMKNIQLNFMARRQNEKGHNAK